MILMKEVVLKKSSNPNKKYDAYVEGKKVSFGARGFSDFTQHKDTERKQRYITRHKANENWNDLTTAGTWSRWLLWEKKTIPEAIRNIEDKFNVKIKIER